jgi:pimeloyl-ACP methyl ester carboxylesterase
METLLTTLNGKQVAYRQRGSGPLVVLLHGFGEDGSIWQQQAEALNGCQVLLPDLPGTGASELMDDMSMEGLAAWLLGLVDQLAGVATRFTLIGHSMGGYITLALAEKSLHRLKGFGLFHSTAYADSEAKKAQREKGIAFIKEHGGAAFLKATIPDLYSPHTKANHPDQIGVHLQMVHNFSDAALVSYYRSMMERPDRTAVLKETGLPVLMVIGKHDGAVPPADGLKQAHLPKISYIHMLSLSGHMGMAEEGAASSRLLNQFIDHIEKTSIPE